jgi:hypothetical protein
MQIVNDKEELVCFVQKTTKAMIMEVKGRGANAMKHHRTGVGLSRPTGR